MLDYNEIVVKANFSLTVLGKDKIIRMKLNKITTSASSVKPVGRNIMNIEIADEVASQFSKAGIANDIAMAALGSALANGIAEMTKEGNVQLDELEDGNIDSKEFMVKVVQRGAESAAKSGAKTMAALSLKEAAKVVGKKLGKDIVKRIGPHTFTAIAYGIVEQGTDTYLYVSGKIQVKEYKVNTAQNVGSVGGAAVGAVLGSAIPVAGSLLGGMLGGYWGAILGKSLGEDFFGKVEVKEEGNKTIIEIEPEDEPSDDENK